jgi:hypothetical protein
MAISICSRRQTSLPAPPKAMRFILIQQFMRNSDCFADSPFIIISLYQNDQCSEHISLPSTSHSPHKLFKNNIFISAPPQRSTYSQRFSRAASLCPSCLFLRVQKIINIVFKWKRNECQCVGEGDSKKVMAQVFHFHGSIISSPG